MAQAEIEPMAEAPRPAAKKAPKGELVFDCSFESGNVGKVENANGSDFEFDISIRADTNNPHYRVWFYFSVSNVRRGMRVIFHIGNCSKTKSLYRTGMTPLVRSLTRPNWERIPCKNCFYYKNPAHRPRKGYTLSFAFAFDKEDDIYYFAYCYPYSYTYLQRLLSQIDLQGFNFWKRELLCETVQNRRVDLLTITSPQPLNDKRQPKKTIVLSARVHPGETPASFVCHGAITFLVSDHPYARLLRNNLVFHIVPMLNPDGVFLGNYRCSSMGYDLNRYWLNPNEWSHAPILHTRNLLLRLADDSSANFEFFIDLHAHSTCTNSFMYANAPAPGDQRVTEADILLFPRLLGINDALFRAQYTKLCRDPSKLGTGRRALGEFLAVAPHCYTLESSFYCGIDSKSRVIPYTEASYVELGRHLALTFADYYKLHPQQSVPPLLAEAQPAKPKRKGTGGGEGRVKGGGGGGGGHS